MYKVQENKPPVCGKHRVLVGWSIEKGARGFHLTHFNFTGQQNKPMTRKSPVTVTTKQTNR